MLFAPKEIVRDQEVIKPQDKIIVWGAIEGGDGSGKLETALEILDLLLSARSIEVNGETLLNGEYSVVSTSFPTYFSPFGQICGLMNKGEMDEYAKERSLTMDEEMNLRMGMFAIDRLLARVFVENFLNDNGYKPVVGISDRSPQSQLTTICYVLEKYGRLDELGEYLNHITSADQELDQDFNWKMIGLLGPPSIGEEGGRSALDKLESGKVQSIVTEALNVLLDIAAEGEKFDVQTRNKRGKWRSRRGIATDVLERMGVSVNVNRSEKRKGLLQKLGDNRLHSPDHFILSAPQVISAAFPKEIFEGREEDWFAAFYGAVYTQEAIAFDNNGETKRFWLERDRKVTLDENERLVANALSLVIVNSDLSRSPVLAQVPGHIKTAARRLSQDYTNNCLADFIQYVEQRNELHPAASKILEQVFLS